MREVDLSQVPYIERNGKKIYQWDKAIGLSLPFVYDEHEGEIVISGREKSDIVFLYNGKKYATDARYLRSGQISHIFSKTIKHRYEVGARIVDKKRDMVITKQVSVVKIKTRTENKMYEYKCNICGFDSGEHNFQINERRLNYGAGCYCCAGKIIVPGINDMATTAPYLLDYLVDKDDGTKYAANSHTRLKVKCAFCGKQHPLTLSPNKIMSQGYSCPYCSDGVSFPEKFIGELLKQNNIKFIRQASKHTFNWCNNFRYDFYLPAYNIIIETHGDQHYDSENPIYHKRYVRSGVNDAEKKELALTNGITDYIEIDCRKSSVDYIKNSIGDTRLLSYLNSDITNYELAGKNSISSYVFEVCKIFSDSPTRETKRKLGRDFGLSETTINRYLAKGREIQLFDIDKLVVSDSFKKDSISKPVTVYNKKNTKTYYFKSVSLLHKEYFKYFKKTASIKCIYQVLNNKKLSYDNNIIAYCSKEEFNNAINKDSVIVVGERFESF